MSTETSEANRPPWQFKPGQSGNPAGRPPSKASRIAAVLEGLRRRKDKATAEEAIAEIVNNAPAEDERHYVAMVMPKQEDPDGQIQSIVIQPMLVTATAPAAAPSPPPATEGKPA